MTMFGIFKVNRDQEKTNLIRSIVNSITENDLNFSQTEQTEILNRISIRVMEKKKEGRSKLLKELRELQQSLIDLKI